MIALITGRPGSGKTLFAQDCMRQAAAEGLDCSVIDDAQYCWPPGAAADLAVYRDPSTGRGISQAEGQLFLLVCQAPRQLPAALLALVQRHYHLTRLDDPLGAAEIATFDRWVPEPARTVPVGPPAIFRFPLLQIRA